VGVSKNDSRLPFIYLGQHFHLYLIAYGIFRFLHEFLRDTPKPFFNLSGYQIIALATALASCIAFYKRKAFINRLAKQE
jgi:phosphatidylglycerol:prolipoprotein diacylglycerol transferase